MNTSIIAVGTELLFGQTLNTNATFLSKNLNLMGFDVMYHFVVGDNPIRLKLKLKEAFDCSDIVILTGGLGPTQDDLTKEIVADYFHINLKIDQRVLNSLNCFFKIRDIQMSENNLKQAYLPEGCVPFYNDAGTAPGFAIGKDGKTAICLPGPPREMTWIFENKVKDYLESIIDKKMYYKIVRTTGISEADLETLLLPIIDNQTDPTIATYVKDGETMFRVASQRNSLEEAKQEVEKLLQSINDICGKYIYSYDNEDLNHYVVKLLKEKNIKLSCAESCTGGLFASSITDVPGASEVFTLSMVTYSLEAKNQELGISMENLNKFGVSSKETAIEMAKSILKKGNADVAISITGNAGPDSYDNQLPGQAYIGYAYKKVSGAAFIDTGVRNQKLWNKTLFKNKMLETLYNIVKNEF